MKKLFIAIVFLAPLLVHAATISIVPVATDTVAVELNTQGVSVNAVEVHLTFDPQEFSVRSIRDGGSIVNAWVTSPTFSNTSDTVDLAGIIPGGIVSTDGVLATIAIIPVSAGVSHGFALASAQVLLNDGKGTPVPFSFEGTKIAMVALSTSSVSGNFAVDTEPPDPFIPEIASDTSVFGGQYFLVFSTTDQDSGIAYYEVLEVPAGSSGGTLSGWQRATSPYLLHDQSLSSDIYVRAVDHAGNFRTVELPAIHRSESTSKSSEDIEWGILISLLLVVGIFTIVFVWRKRR